MKNKSLEVYPDPKTGEGREDGRKSGLRRRRVGDTGCHAWGFSTLANEDSRTGPGYCRGLPGLEPVAGQHAAPTLSEGRVIA